MPKDISTTYISLINDLKSVTLQPALKTSSMRLNSKVYTDGEYLHNTAHKFREQLFIDYELASNRHLDEVGELLGKASDFNGVYTLGTRPSLEYYLSSAHQQLSKNQKYLNKMDYIYKMSPQFTVETTYKFN